MIGSLAEPQVTQLLRYSGEEEFVIYNTFPSES